MQIIIGFSISRNGLKSNDLPRHINWPVCWIYVSAADKLFNTQLSPAPEHTYILDQWELPVENCLELESRLLSFLFPMQF